MAKSKLMSWLMINKSDDENLPSILKKDFSKKKPEKYLNYLDKHGRNLLIIAVNSGSNKKVKELLTFGFDTETLYQGKTAVSLAYENKNFDIVLTLLENNSKFPRNFNANETGHEELKKFAEITKEFHLKISQLGGIKEEDILDYKNFYPNCKHFYGLNGEFFNRSIAFAALKNQNFELYEVFKKHKIAVTCKELKWIDFKKDEGETAAGAFFNKISFSSENLPYTLFTKTHIGHNIDDKEETRRYNKVIETFRYLNSIPEISSLLKYLTKVNDFRIFLDFSRIHEKIVNIRRSQDVTKYIYIGAKELHKGDENCLKIYGIIIKELCRFVIEQIYNNVGKPYKKSNKDAKTQFKEAFNECQQNCTQEPLINAVFTSCYEHSKEAELITTVPQIFVLYSNNPTRLETVKSSYKKIFQFYEIETAVDAEDELERNMNEIENSILIYLGSIEPGKMLKRKMKIYFVTFALILSFLVIFWVVLRAQKFSF